MAALVSSPLQTAQGAEALAAACRIGLESGNGELAPGAGVDIPLGNHGLDQVPRHVRYDDAVLLREQHQDRKRRDRRLRNQARALGFNLVPETA